MNTTSAVRYNKRRGYPDALWRRIQTLVGASVDGKTGPETARKVAEWQRANGLSDDGMVGPSTLEAMGLAEVAAAEPPTMGPLDTRVVAASGERRIQLIDVSLWQGDVDWQRVKRWSGVRGAIIKASQEDFSDPRALEHIEGARRAGLPHGAYHLCIPVTKRGEVTDPLRGAEQFALTVKDDPGPLGAWLDLETKHAREGVAKLGKAGVVDWLLAHVAEVEKRTGQTPGIYWSHRGARVLGDEAQRLFHLPAWWALYFNAPPIGVEAPPRVPDGARWDVWQWTSSGRVPGIKGNVDLNVVNPASPLAEVLTCTPPKKVTKKKTTSKKKGTS